MDFANRITRLPRAHSPDRGAEAHALFPEHHGATADLLEGAAGCSPYLRLLMEKETTWLTTALHDPEAALAQEMKDQRATTGDPASALRRGKRRIALLTGLADLAGVWSLEQVTQALTGFADLACDVALRHAIAAEIRRGKLPGQGDDALDTAGGMVVLAMGKMGAGELNYSSDIDLICLFDETRFSDETYHDARASFIRATRRMAATLSENTAEGYVFRTDLRLRPDPGVTPVCMAMAGAEAYYESLGRTWERAAYIKARPAAGDIAAGNQFLKALTAFVWRKHLDFAAIEDAHNMRLRIRKHKGLAGGTDGLDLMGHNMKLGRGGIREIEFFTQTRQIIAGGRDPDLRRRGTVEGLAMLAQKGWVPDTVAADLTDHYRFHREVEHRLQMLRDAQTHTLPTTMDEFDRLAAFMGRDTPDLMDEIRRRLTAVDTVIERFFNPDEDATPAAPSDDGAPDGSPEDVPELDEAIIARWPSYPALRSARAGQIFRRLRPELLCRLARTSHPDEALVAFDGFLAGLPAGVQVFSLFEANPHLIDLLVDIVGTAPKLASYLSRNAAVFDAVIAGDFFALWPGRAALTAELSAQLQAETDYERRLDTARRWRREWHFRIGVHHLRGLVDARTSARHYADLAEAIVTALWPCVGAEFATKHGPPPGRGAVLVGMGSLGAGTLSATSDLDMIMIYDAAGVETSEGRRPLPARTYYARLTQAMITALSAQMAGGRLYEVDMRLRPSGNQGPVATPLAAFAAYQREKAWVWEHLAMTRARVITGDPSLADEVEAFRTDLLKDIAANPATPAKVLVEVADMNARLAAAKRSSGPLDAKYGPGRMQQIELIAQAATMMAGGTQRSISAGLSAGVAIGWWDDAASRALGRAFSLCWSLQMAVRLLSGDKGVESGTLGAGARDFVLRETGQPDLDTLHDALEQATGTAAQIIETALTHRPERTSPEAK
ncbi:bifunctional [glutamine synthetase] adenylyltransferase/[glutamine synthetase]-adenylyl-L-tyrosine phosphorylase [Rhodobacteraceae bacterium KMM 6894]|nr:bifunctional [glutamine synthetase] adenylyltransferase/[glutamine synthetase]-adenylyl-L-tyrosine phosphorylase [Rhodobacteraceae bacterium KMM 6894]